MSYIVYKHTSPSGKVYIGLTSQTVCRRWRSDGRGYRKCPAFWPAITKYGWDNFEHEILFEGLSQEEAEQKEIEMIDYYKSNDSRYGYNIENGGKANKVSEAQKKHLSEINKGKHHSEETKRKISEGNKGKHKLTEEQKQKMRAGRKYEKPAWNKGMKGQGAKKVWQYDKGGKLLEVYESQTEAKEKTGATHISDCARGKRKSDKGFIWSYTPIPRPSMK